MNTHTQVHHNLTLLIFTYKRVNTQVTYTYGRLALFCTKTIRCGEKSEKQRLSAGSRGGWWGGGGWRHRNIANIHTHTRMHTQVTSPRLPVGHGLAMVRCSMSRYVLQMQAIMFYVYAPDSCALEKTSAPLSDCVASAQWPRSNVFPAFDRVEHR